MLSYQLQELTSLYGGSAYFKFAKDFWNVDRRRSETKEVLSKKITQHARYKTCTFLSCPTPEKKTLNNQLLRPLSRETSAAIWSCFYQKLKGSCRNVRDSERVKLQAGLRCSKGSLRFPLREAAVRLFPS